MGYTHPSGAVDKSNRKNQGHRKKWCDSPKGHKFLYIKVCCAGDLHLVDCNKVDPELTRSLSGD